MEEMEARFSERTAQMEAKFMNMLLAQTAKNDATSVRSPGSAKAALAQFRALTGSTPFSAINKKSDWECGYYTIKQMFHFVMSYQYEFPAKTQSMEDLGSFYIETTGRDCFPIGPKHSSENRW